MCKKQSTCVHPRFKWGSCYSIVSFMSMFCRSLFVLCYFFLLAIVLSVLLRYTDSDCPFLNLQTLLNNIFKKHENTRRTVMLKNILSTF